MRAGARMGYVIPGRDGIGGLDLHKKKPVLAWEREARYNGDTVFTTT